MSFLQRFILSRRQHNAHLNHIACIENDYSSKSCEKLLELLAVEKDEDILVGITKILVSRGYSRKELQQIASPQQTQ